jgi:methionine sulfoxide reductase catalytic subunit
MKKIQSSEITPEHIYHTRRDFIKGMGFLAGASLLAACAPDQASEIVTNEPPPTLVQALASDELGDPVTDYEAVTNFNNYYEFSLDKTEVAPLSRNFVSSPWSVEVGGLVANPGVYDIDNLRSDFEKVDRTYRMRCVEGWSMVIPWNGFTLNQLLQKVEPLSDAKYVRFETLYDLDQYPGQKSAWYQWPYIEGLRLDEAMNDLTLLATGLYGRDLLPQNGAPIRLVIPWKYGFKSIKSIVKIDLVEKPPVSLWMAAQPSEYGFYANVNPDVSHPRWSQTTERRISETGRRSTLPFNGYAEEVAELYAGMDLKANY